MKDYITGQVSTFPDSKNVVAATTLISIEGSEQIKSESWQETIKAMNVDSAIKGQTQFSKAWNDKPAKMIQWFKEDGDIRYEIWYQKKGEEWTFKNEYVISLDALKAFEPIHNYNLEIMNSLKKDFTSDTLEGTSFLARDK